MFLADNKTVEVVHMKIIKWSRKMMKCIFTNGKKRLIKLYDKNIDMHYWKYDSPYKIGDRKVLLQQIFGTGYFLQFLRL